jgi:hypothetical protein
MKVDGTGRVKIADDGRDPSWSPDGRKIAYLPNEYERMSYESWSTRGLRVYDLKKRKTRDHPNPDLEHLYTLGWSHNGRWFIATVHGGMGLRHNIIALEANGKRFYDLGLPGCRADLSADGSRITWGNGDYAIGTAKIDLSGDRPVTSSNRNVVDAKEVTSQQRRAGMAPRPRNMTYHADWSPDGQLILFSAGMRRRGRMLRGGTPQCPGIEAPGWDVWVADPRYQNVCLNLSLDGASNKEPDWVPAVRSK